MDGATDVTAVRKHLLEARGGTTGSWAWTDRYLDAADRQFGGQWRFAELSGDKAQLVVLPPHAGEPCHGDRLGLVPAGGATVREAARRLNAIRSAYESENRECWTRLASAARAPFSTVVVTTAPLDTPEHRGLSPASGSFHHLDGFHRLVGWAWAGRLTREVRLTVIVAGSCALQL